MSKPEKQKTVQVTSLKTLGAAPEFRLPVTIKRLDGEEVTIGFTAKAMKKTEWAAKRDAFLNPAKVEEPGAEEAAPAAKFSFVDVVQGDMSKGAELVMEFASGWDLEDQFSAESLGAMEDQFGGSLGATLSAYDAAIFHGRLGN